MKQAPSGNVERVGIGRLARLTRKELRETLRDRRTVITLVLMPLLVYPLLSITFQKFLLSNINQTAKTVYVVGVEAEADHEILERYLREGDRSVSARTAAPPQRDSNGEKTADTLATAAESQQPELQWAVALPLEQSVANFDVHVGVRVRTPDGAIVSADWKGPIQCELFYRGNSPVSKQVMYYIEERLRAVNELALRRRLSRMGVPPRVPASIARHPVEVEDEVPFSLATLVPLVLILMTITGAVYPAIDLTAGEQERGTMETLIAAPISRLALLLAKYVAVLTVAVLTAVVNLVAMTVTIMNSALAPLLLQGGTLSLLVVLQVFGLLILFAAFFSAVLLVLTSFARSFKEAQAYLIPVMLLAISPGLLSLMPGLELNQLLAITPLVNIVLLTRDLLGGNANPVFGTLAVLSTALYAVVAIAIAARIFGNDALLYASRGSWTELLLRPTAVRERPTAITGVFCLLVMFPIYFVLGNAALSQTEGIGGRLSLNALVTAVVFVLCPLAFAIAQRVRISSGFGLHRALIGAFVGAAILGIGLWPFAHYLFLLGARLGMATLDESQFAAVKRMLDGLSNIPLPLTLLTLAVAPAVCEEFFFRGFLFQGLRDRLSGWGVVLTTALLFGLFHVATPSVLSPERFLPSTFMGLALGWVCLRTGSLLPGMLLHACHNGLLLTLVHYREDIIARGWGVLDQESLPWWWLVIATFLVIAGGLIILFSTTGFGSRGTADLKAAGQDS